MRKMHRNWRLFVKEYLRDLNGTQAAIRAGFSRRSARTVAWELLKRPDVQVLVEKGMREREKVCEVDATWVLQRLKIVAERAMVAVPVLNREGEETGEYRFDSAGANKALELMGKHCGLFGDQLTLKGSAAAPLVLQVEEGKVPNAGHEPDPAAFRDTYDLLARSGLARIQADGDPEPVDTVGSAPEAADVPDAGERP